jgi:hypothetical protein
MDWERRLADLWASIDDHTEQESDDLDDAVAATLALALVDVGREREAVSIAVTALSRHMTRYRRSMANYARRIADRPSP